MERDSRLREILEKAFHPAHLEISDQTQAHAGHAEAKKSGGGHFAVFIVSATFQNKTRLERHRLVYDEVFSRLHGTVHALAIKALTVEEWDSAKAKIPPFNHEVF